MKINWLRQIKAKFLIRMATFPTDLSSVNQKETLLLRLRFFLQLWGQNKRFFKICAIICVFKVLTDIARSAFVYQSMSVNLDFLIEVTSVCFISFLATLKINFMLVQRERIHFLFDEVKNNFWDLEIAGKNLGSQLRKRYKFLNKFALGYFVMGTATSTIHMISMRNAELPEGRTRWLPIYVTVPTNPEKTPFYQILFFDLFVMGLMTSWGNIIYDLTFVYGAQLLCGQFELLSALLLNLDEGILETENSLEKFRSDEFQKKIFQRLSFCVEHHNRLLRYSKELQKLTSLVFGIQLLTTWLTLVLLGYRAEQDVEGLLKSPKILFAICSLLAQFIVLVIQSGIIQIKSSSVAEAAYQSNWHVFNAKTKRGLSFLMMNSQQGVSMYGLGLVEINNEILVTLLQKVFSCITLLNKLMEN